jgi:hypothetical protein
VHEAPDVDATVRAIESLVDMQPESAELAGLLMQLYGAGLTRIVEVIREENGESILERLAGDKLAASLLLLHGLHPVDAATRLRKALQKLERRFEAQRVSLAEIKDGVAFIRVEHNGGGTPPAALADMIEQAAMEVAPELEGIEIEGAAHAAVLVQIAPAPVA